MESLRGAFSSKMKLEPRSQDETPVDDAQVTEHERHETECSNKPDASPQESGDVDHPEDDQLDCHSKETTQRATGRTDASKSSQQKGSGVVDDGDEDSDDDEGPRWMTASELKQYGHIAAEFNDSAMNWDALKDVCSKIRDGISCKLDDKFAVGEANIVRKIVFEDDKVWVARVRYHHISKSYGTIESGHGSRKVGYYRNDRGQAMASEVATLRFLKSKTSIPVPEVYGYDSDESNPVGGPYILMEYIDGTRANNVVVNESASGDIVWLTDQEDYKKQLLAIQAELAANRFDRIGSIYEDSHEPSGYKIGMDPRLGEGPWDTSPEFFSSVATNAVESISNVALNEIHEMDNDGCSALPYISEAVMMKYRDQSLDKGPFALSHLELWPGHILVNDDFKIVAVLATRNICAVPIELQAQAFIDSDFAFMFPTASADLKWQKELSGNDFAEFIEYRRLLGECEKAVDPHYPVSKSPSTWLTRPGALAYRALYWYGDFEADITRSWTPKVLRMLSSGSYPFLRKQ